MKSPTSSTVCHTTPVSLTKTISQDSHHHKLHVNAYSVPFNIRCADGSLPVGRSFIIKSLVRLNSGNDNHDYVVLERGQHHDPDLVYYTGYSITNVILRY